MQSVDLDGTQARLGVWGPTLGLTRVQQKLLGLRVGGELGSIDDDSPCHGGDTALETGSRQSVRKAEALTPDPTSVRPSLKPLHSPAIVWGHPLPGQFESGH